MAAVRGRLHHRHRGARHRGQPGGFADDAVTSLLVLGGLLALYDGAEVLLKPVFGTLAERDRRPTGAAYQLLHPLEMARCAR
ncbi:hypothetical protein [Streptomyces sp. KR80]|uniref:hypothetical protein n=1 Tax=Streptomyces sp. KR80 TaxID=3457426 RepID=UPI003FD24EF0